MSEQVPLVDEDHHRAPGGVDPLAEALVLVGHTLGGIEHEQCHVGVIERSQRPHERVVLGALAASGSTPHACGVDELDRAVLGLDQGVDGIARRPGKVVDDGALLARQPVEQRRLADVRATHDRHGRDAGRRAFAFARAGGPPLAGRGLLRQPLHDLVEQIADATPVQGAHHRRLAEAETRELPGVGLAALGVDLVCDHDHRPCVTPDELRHDGVLPRHARGGVHHEQYQVGLAEGPERLLGHLGVEGIPTLDDPAGVYDEKRPSVPLALQLQPIARHPRARLDDGHLPACEPVHERRLADVRAAHDGHHREPGGARGHRTDSRARRSEAPSAGTTSSGVEMSSSAVPSMNLPFDRHTSGSR